MLAHGLYKNGKRCAHCERVLPARKFGRRGKYLRAYCMECERAKARVRIGLRVRGEPYGARRPGFCRNGHRLIAENTYVRPNGDRQCRTCRREYDRIWAERRRRLDGVKAVGRVRETPVAYGERIHLDAGPFAEWLRENAPAGEGERTAWAGRFGVNESTIRRIVDGTQLTVHIDTVDRVVGPAVLNELYPVDESVAA